ncbi:MAG TPA: type II toxin-antitoxin system Phd/YefM family antitoxin [Thermoanaerobaculia bacterium]|jgi:prevent-host-death family protein|nr:type II toxin-antitoxin system Phd/YefM family antitoxin [Thermoanaerobaculia bacterium]
MKKAALSDVKDDLSRYLRLAENEEIVITRHGRPAGVLIGFKSEDEWFEYRLESDPRFLARIEAARRGLGAGRGVPLEEIPE